MTKTSQGQIEEIMNNFDFAEVHRVMTLMDWVWGEATTPNVEQLRAFALTLLTDVSGGELVSSRSGGFLARNDYGQLRLSFEIESYETEIED